VGLLEAVEAVLPAAGCRHRAVDVLLGGGGRQHPLLVLRRGEVGRWGQQLRGVVGARGVRVVSRVRRVRSTAQENPTVVLLGGGDVGFGGILGLRQQNTKWPQKHSCPRKRRGGGHRHSRTSPFPYLLSGKRSDFIPTPRLLPRSRMRPRGHQLPRKLPRVHGLPPRPHCGQQVPPRDGEEEKSEEEPVS